jgi:uncharacterized Zn finger protein
VVGGGWTQIGACPEAFSSYGDAIETPLARSQLGRRRRALIKKGAGHVSADEAKDLTTTVTPRLLRRLAGERAFERGEAYFAEGAVRSLRRRDGGVEARVQGTSSYRVRLAIEDGDLTYECTCPVGQDSEFCKHCVAVGLAWHAAGEGNIEACPGEEDVRKFLLGLEKEELVSMLLDRASEDERLQRRLTLLAASPGTAAPRVWKQALDEALATGGFVPYREAYDHVSGVEEVIDRLGELLQSGQAESVVELAEYGLAAVEEGLEEVDDSDGLMAGLLDKLQELHLAACRMARPDPVAFAERLFELERESEFGAFHQAVAVYADVLGEAGRAAYRRLAETAWAMVPALGPGDQDPNRYGGRYRITSIMEAIVRADGDLEALVAVKSRDLSLPHAFLEIAELYQETGDFDRALEWAERGWRAFSDQRADERLRAFVADAYQRQGCRDEAMALVWAAFAESPWLGTYRQLEQHGKRARQWPAWRERALSLIRGHLADAEAEPPGRPTWTRSPTRDHSLLVEIFLHEGDAEGAWREAMTGGCSTTLWLALAKGREQSHPADAVRVYKGHVALLLRNTGDGVYREAVSLLDKIRTLLARCGEDAEFRAFLTEVRATHRRKRNLLQLLDRKGW